MRIFPFRASPFLLGSSFIRESILNTVPLIMLTSLLKNLSRLLTTSRPESKLIDTMNLSLSPLATHLRAHSPLATHLCVHSPLATHLHAHSRLVSHRVSDASCCQEATALSLAVPSPEMRWLSYFIPAHLFNTSFTCSSL